MTRLVLQLLNQRLQEGPQQPGFSPVLLVAQIQSAVKACILGQRHWKLLIIESEEKTPLQLTEMEEVFPIGKFNQ